MQLTRLIAAAILLSMAYVSRVHAAELPDSGQTVCYDSASAVTTGVDVDGGTFPRQDCRYGRDAAAKSGGVLTKVGAGAAGFDYTKVANNGSDVAASTGQGLNPADWACTRDNITGLVWEVKVNNAAHLRHSGWQYTWYDSNSSSNAGLAGTPDTGVTVGSDNCLNNARCDTEKFTADVNTAALCGFTDWRLPTIRELKTLVHAGVSSPAIDPTYFPNTTSPSLFWSASSFANSIGNAWNLNVADGNVGANGKSDASVRVRLVRGVQF